MKYKISHEENAPAADLTVLHNNLIEYGTQKKCLDITELFAFFVRDENNKILGGCSGENMYGCLFIAQLWVSESLRGQNYGTKLMQAAEKLGQESGCTFAIVTTFDWEALDFYKKLGYEVEFERRGYVKDSIFYSLRKNFISSQLY